ncbi:phosphoribosylformylglycinamidine cyclo-ligase [Thermomicrobium sp. 4228-Ro]|uniref:phosphoribosylformylglycinamidine cyclo-ligase n=1 Tax=Thermomicrobium sp. 4228-Ro TaxID=2993937 RepID=UPI00224882E8|nr:phosphoribosylformylglycinamidine cyclo-ligase [Thermomicrobium sp. 4228-Ro]MCX2726059.1 phosphoribosylformylglycinamidine cyclo-ligase [Thermomicrobium sp. 4228-Ro]
MESLSYARTGVDLTRAEAVKARIARAVEETFTRDVLRPLGLFGGVFAAPGSDGQLALVATIDSVGTKILVANVWGVHEGIGIDLVHHSANDLLACGAFPLFFLDYFATARLDDRVLEELVRGMTRACRDLGCALIGGETAQLPGIYTPGAYDLAGCMVGVVPVDRIVDGSRIVPGDVVLGLPSNGLHTNGYSLARASLGMTGNPERDRSILEEIPPWADRPLGELLLQPHRCYVPLLRESLGNEGLHGMAHITGGGLVENIARIVPSGCRVEIDSRTWEIPEIFGEIQRRGQIDTAEMFRVFNMGVGFVVIGEAAFIADLRSRLGEGWILGRVLAADGPRVVLRYGEQDDTVLVA